MAIFKSAVNSVADRLPWGMRRIVRRFISFVDVHGFSAFFASRPTFRGVYSSFADVPGSIDLVKPELARSSVDNLNGVRTDLPSGLPLLGEHRELLPMVVALLARDNHSLNILDFGGGAGIDFRNLLRAQANKQVTYCIVDLPEVCERARPLWSGETQIEFRSTLPEQTKFDIVYSWSAIQYVPEPLDLLRRFTQYRPHAILIVGSPFTAGNAFVREQLNRSRPFPQWVLSLPEVTSTLQSCGYRLAFHAEHEHDYNVDGYPADFRVANSASLLFLSNDG